MAKTIKVDIVGDAKELYEALDKSTEKLDRFGRVGSSHIGKAEKAVKAFKIAGLASIPVVGLLSYQLLESVKAAAESEQEYSLLRATVRTTGQSWEQFEKQVKDTIETQSLATGFARTELIPAYNTLDRATGSVAKSSRLLAIAEDVARGKHISVAAAAATLGKAWTGSLSSLRRLGVEIPKNATKLEALRIVQKKFGGEAQAYANTAAGGLDRLNVAYDKVKETIGEALLPTIIRLTNRFTDWLTQAQKTGELRRDIQKVQHVLKVVAQDAADVQSAFEAIRGPVGAVTSFARHHWLLVQNALNVVTGGLTSLIVNFHQVAQTVGSVTAFVRARLVNVRSVIASVTGVVRRVGGAFQGAFGAARGAIQSVIDLVDSLISKIRSIPSIHIPGSGLFDTARGLLPHTGGLVTREGLRFASGGIAVGGSPGRDSIPALLSPGEVVLNKRQQLALLRGGSGQVNVNVTLGPETMREFARVEVEAYGRKTAQTIRRGRKVQ